MKNTTSNFKVSLLVFIFLVQSVIAQSGKGTLKIEVYGFTNSQGMARVLIFTSEQKKYFPGEFKKALVKKVVPIVDKKVTVEFADLPLGEYAVSVHHDMDNNGEINTNWLGIPNEGIGVSNDAKGSFGPPSYKDAKFQLSQPKLSIKINMHYL